ncbi:AMP-binding protein [Kitasatospora sp. NPDC058115]|uniref:AMP-binding protein n=1 Tax=Kitasatospora sp. NPDC058115 TaxID=3346347 RepID=UPI0036DBE701
MTRNPTEPGPPAPSDDSPVRRFRAVVARSGERLAVQGPAGAWTYRELDAVSDALAARVRATAGPGARIGLVHGHDIGLIAAVLAALKAGAAYLPLDLQQSPARLSAAVAAGGPDLLLADAAHAGAAGRLAEGRPVLTATDEGAPPPPFAPADTPGALARLRPPAGAGAAPQGLTGRDLLTRALRFADRLGLTAEDRVPLLAHGAADGPAPELLGALLTGASLHLVDPRATPRATLLGELVRHRATVLACTPDLLRLLLVQSAAGAPVPGPRAVLLDGEGFTARDAQHAARAFAGAELLGATGADGGPADPWRRSEPAEAEVLLRAHPTVRHAAVLAAPDAAPGHRLIGYLTSPGPQAAAPGELLRYLHSLLPEYAVPTRLVVLPRLPLDPAGRLDPARLPAPAAAEQDDSPRTARERRIAALWCEVLARPTATLRDHFFAAGGDSARVMHLLDRVRAEYGVDVPLPAFLADPTPATLARLVDGAPAPQHSHTTEEAGPCA